MEPRVLKRGRKVHLRYDIPHRIHCSSVYPLTAPNGSTVILYGYDAGLRILWRGGRRPRQQSRPRSQTNGVSKSRDVIVIDDDEDNEAPEQVHAEPDYEPDEDQRDPDCPFSSIIQTVDVDLDTAVLRLAAPALPHSKAPHSVSLAQTHAIVAVACANGKISLITIPLVPPTAPSINHFVTRDIREVELSTDSILAKDISLKLITNNDEPSSASPSRRSDKISKGLQGQMVVGVTTNRLQLWTIDISATSLSSPRTMSSPVLRLPSSGSKVSFHPPARSRQLLCAESGGVVRIYDMPELETNMAGPATSPDSGRWVMSYLAPFQTRTDQAALVRRKRLLGAEWVLGGRGIFALSEDGEWGIWDLNGKTQPGRSAGDFVLNGYLTSTSTTDVKEAAKPKKSLSNLAPMTPNTRKSKAEHLFGGPSRASAVASSGGISVSRRTNFTGASDESVIIWYNSAVFSIPSLQAFWQRNINSKSGRLGSLYAPALTQISDVELMNEHITSVSQLAGFSASSSGSLGPISDSRDVLISAEHRFIIIEDLHSGARNAVRPSQQQLVERPGPRDRRMLDAGELDIGGMDRMLDNMAGATSGRRVGFAT